MLAVGSFDFEDLVEEKLDVVGVRKSNFNQSVCKSSGAPPGSSILRDQNYNGISTFKHSDCVVQIL